ncbi:reverse transcriptase [Tanacetum coccineum]|uniref:Reverse transcriptase n=1 Tax=Tanacetum coccineum TaxID=301880 RepID=A0ABQ5H6K6_9ASTR
MAKLLLMDYHKANQQQVTTTRIKATVKWTKPNDDYIKFNCDASYQKEFGRVGLGFVARDARGDVLLSRARAECYASSPLEAEAKSLLWATNQAHNKGRDERKCYFKHSSFVSRWSISKQRGEENYKAIWDYLARLNVLSDYVASTILKEENRRNNREDRQTISRQVKALMVTRGRSMDCGPNGPEERMVS